MDDFKRVYSNEDTVEKALPYFWEHFDAENYSVWYSEYKFPKELSQVFMSCNLIGGVFIFFLSICPRDGELKKIFLKLF